MKRYFELIFFIFLLNSIYLSLLGQDTLKNESYIEIIKKDTILGDISKVISKSQKVKVDYIKSGKICRVKGRINEINDSIIFVKISKQNFYLIKIDSIKIIGRQNLGMGIPFLGIGVSFTSISGFMFYFASTANLIFFSSVDYIAGLLSGAIGVPLTIVGILVATLSWNNFNTSEGWVISVKHKNKRN